MIVLCLTISLVVILIDQLTKIFLLNNSFTYINYVLYNVPSLNDGAAFSMFSGGRIFFLVFTVIVLFVIAYFLIDNKFSKSKFFKISLAVATGGIVGNFIDRLMFGAVRDFLYVEPFGFICNVADIAICVGTALVCYYIVFKHKFKQKTKSEAKALDDDLKDDEPQEEVFEKENK